MGTQIESVCLQILTPLTLKNREDGEKLLQLWEGCLPECLPDKIGNWEPIDQPFDSSKRDLVLDHWQNPFLAVKKKPKMNAYIGMRPEKRPLHASLRFTLRFGQVDVPKLGNFLQALSRQFKADFGCVTLFTQTEIDFGRRNRTAWNLDRLATIFDFDIYSQHLQKCIPDVYWMTIFGAPYVNMFGREKLLGAPAYRIEVLDDRLISLQLTPNLEDVKKDPAGFLDTKKRIKAHLGEDAFYQVGKLGLCKAPEFTWG